jgi:alanine racemase
MRDEPLTLRYVVKTVVTTDFREDIDRGLTPQPRPARLTVDLGAVAANTRLLKARTSAELMAVVKANGFGHGAAAVARTALNAGASWLGVTSLEEALALRVAGLTEVRILSWLNAPGTDFGAAHRHRIDLAVPSQEILAEVAAVGGGIRVHLHLDSGMSRDGAGPDLWRPLCEAARAFESAGRIQVVGLMSHLGRAGEPGAAGDSEESEARFRRGVAIARESGLRPSIRHLAATAATLTARQTHFDLVRVGAGLVGIDPSGTTRLRSAMTLTAPLIHIRAVEAGTPVGYGHTWRAARRTNLGLLPLGYADGLPRRASNRAEVWLRGRRCPVVGLISMDQCVIDLGDDSGELGATVTVFGSGAGGEPTVTDWARWASTIEHDIVTGITGRVYRHVIEPSEQSQES